MRLEEKYLETFEKMEQYIAGRIQTDAYMAFGYTSNLDILCDFKIEILNQLLEKYLQNANLREMKVPTLITGMKEFLETIVYFCSKGIGGEVDIKDFEIIKDTFSVKKGIGGTAAQAAMALAAVGCPSVIHLTDDSQEVREILESPYIYTVSEDGKLVHTQKLEQTKEQEIHYIIQFKKGDVLCLGGQMLTIPCSNRLIITKITVNETVPFSEAYFTYLEEHACSIKSNVLSSFNAIQEEKTLKERLTYVKKHIEAYQTKYPQGIVYFEDAHYHNLEVRKLCLEGLYPHVDMVSLNEEELEYTLQMYQVPIEIDNILSCIQGAVYIAHKFSVKKGIVVHTKDYAMYVGEEQKADIEEGLMLGNLMATAKAMHGFYGSKEQLGEVMKLPFSKSGYQNRQLIENERFDKKVILVPTKYLDKPKYTVGLGDSFVAGVQLCFM